MIDDNFKAVDTTYNTRWYIGYERASCLLYHVPDTYHVARMS